ncbi:hypothetical protein KAJ27_23535 [bacterium]|nr:hypothetical protein [bacterium]
MKRLLLGFMVLISGSAFAQLNWEAEVSPLYRMQFHDQSALELPFRMVEAAAGYSYSNIEFTLSADVESRWNELSKSGLNLRELYFHAYPSFGEVKIGRQILAWGYADQNNPTDNINPYNYYYLFDLGINRKEAVNAAVLNLNLGDVGIEAVLAEHSENIFPYDEDDFPVTIPAAADPRGRTQDLENPYEYGLRLQHSMLGVDYSLSWWQGYDKQASPVRLSTIIEVLPPPMQFSYRPTSVLGADFVTFIGDFTLRSENAFFMTENILEATDLYNFILPLKSQYLQYIVQLEYSAPLDIQLSAQYMGHTILSAEGVHPYSLKSSMMSWAMSGQGNEFIIPVNDISGIFKSALGSPLHGFLESALSLSASRLFLDDRLDIRFAGIFNLKESGQIYSFSADYILNDALELQLYSSIIHSASTDPTDFFNMMEDFSHLGLGLSYRIASM